MKVKAHKLITANFLFSLLALLAAAAGLTLRVINDTTGLDLAYFAPGCTNTYNNLKYSFTYLMLIVQFVANALAIVTALLRSILFINPLRDVCKGSEDNGSQPGYKEVKLQLAYVCVSLQMLCWIVSVGGWLNIWIEAKSCIFQVLFYNILALIISIVGALLTLVCWILVICLNQMASAPTEISFDDLKPNREQDQLSRRMDNEMRDYLESIENNKRQMQKQLLAYEQQIYQSNKKNHQTRENKGQQQSQPEEESEYEYYYEQVEVEAGEAEDNIDEEAIEQIEEQGDQIMPSPVQKGAPLSRGISKRSRKEVADLEVDLQKVPYANEQEWSNQEEQNDNIVGGIEITNNRKLGQISRNSSSNTSPKQKTPANPKRGEAIEDDQSWALQSFRLQASSKPNLSEQLGKLLKITLFDNSAFFVSDKPQLQQECPLEKYLERDQRFEIPQLGKFNKKSRRNEYSKEQLFFAKKRKDKTNEQSLYRSMMKEEYNESLAVKRERADLLNRKQVQHVEEIQKEREQHLAARYKKYNILQSIRSKYHN